ncbi:MAG: ATP-dependent helicase [Roseburia sp.]|nr:ATP-dependent helicase [Roseburia sp.]
MIEKLNEGQEQAIKHGEGPMMVLAGPGSGKTFTITKRIEYLIKEKGIDPSHILVITFTKAAAGEMKERFLKQMPAEGKTVTFGTFHAVFFMILKHAYHFQADNIIREEDKIRWMREEIHSMRLDFEDENEFIRNILGEISLVKNTGVDIKHYYSISLSQDIFFDIFREYQEFLVRNRKIDFDDMLVYTYELFSQRKDILSAWQDKYRYILIDEFQDVNQLQYNIVRMLAAPKNNLFVVGDDDQSIYHFRGARPEIMLHMPEQYKDLRIVKLRINYRCPSQVVEIAARIIENNKQRFEKKIEAFKNQGDAVTFEVFDRVGEENEKLIQNLKSQKSPLSDTAVLFRTNLQARPLMEKLLEYNIPFTAKDRVPNLYEHWIAKDMYAYIRIAQGSRQRRDFLMIMNRPKRYLSRESLESETVAFDVWQNFYSEQDWMIDRIDKLWQDIKMIRTLRPFAAINYIRKAVGYDDFLREYAQYRSIKEEDLFGVMEELQESARGFLTFQDWFLHIERYKEEIENMWEKNREDKDALTIATFHSAKGLEFESVHIMEVNEGITPYKKASLPAEMEEERRMFYVALTRTKNRLHLYAVKHYNNHEAELSRFLYEARKKED